MHIEADKPLSVLRIVLTIEESSAPYNQFSLPLFDKQNISICTYFRPKIAVPEQIKLFAGRGTVLSFFRALRAALAENTYDVIHAHTPHVGFLFIIASLFINAKLLRSTVFTLHSSYPNFKLRNRLLLICVFAFYRRIIACGYASFESFPWFFKWLAGDRLKVIQNGVDTNRIERVISHKQKRSHTDNFRIISVNRIIELKNPVTLLRAFRRISEKGSDLIFIGDGQLKNLLNEEIYRCHLETQIKLIGLIPRDRVYDYLSSADLFVSASKGEGLPVAVLEAMFCGCPVILSDIPPHREIADGVDFIPLIAPDFVDGFAKEMERIRNMSYLKKLELGEKYRKLVEERFSLTAMHEGYNKIYREILAAQRFGR